jgi:hypothetical protein
MRNLGTTIAALTIAIAIGACGSDKERKFADPNPDDDFVAFVWPNEDEPLPASSIRIEGPLVAFVDTTTGRGTPVTFKVLDGGNDVTAQANFGVRELRNGSFTGATFTPVMGVGDPAAITTIIGAKVGDKFAFAHLVIVRQARSGAALDATAIARPNAAAEPSKIVMKVGGGINRIDIALVIDTTGTMASSIADIKTNLQTKIVPDLQKNIPDLAIGLAETRDYPIGSYGDSGDYVVFFHHTMTVDIATVQNTLGKIGIGSGADLPEGQMPALLHTLTGTELKWSGGSIAARAAPAGRLGAIGIRPGALPVVVLVTDDIWHEEPTPDPYDPAQVFTHVTMPQLASAFAKLNARFVDVSIAGKELQADRLSDLTNSNIPVSAFASACGAGKCCTGVNGEPRDPSAPGGRCRLNFLHNKGEGVSASLTKAIKSLSIGSVFDVTAAVSKGEGTDVTKLVQAIAPLTAGDAKLGCPAHEAFDANGDGTPETFRQLPADKPVCFELTLGSNTLVPAKPKPQVATVRLDVTGNPGNVLLDRRTIVFVVPPGS